MLYLEFSHVIYSFMSTRIGEGIPSNHVHLTLRAGDYTVPPQHYWCCDQFSIKEIRLASQTRHSEIVVL